MRRHLTLYVFVLLLFGGGTWLVVSHGPQLTGAAASPGGQSGSVGGAHGSAPTLGSGFVATLQAPLATLLLQMIVIVAAARGLGLVFRRIGQPAVIGEMVAGILLGPSLLGWLAPAAQAFLFPPSSLATLQLLSQVGVILFMFVVGIEVDVAHLRERAHTALLVSHASILVPFFLGSALAVYLYRSLAPSGVPFSAFALFIGVAMSITAFPVLARIIEERGLAGTTLGTTAIACAAVDDVTAWCMLAVVVAIVEASSLSGALVSIVLSLVFIGLMLFGVRPWVARRLAARPAGSSAGQGLLAAILTFAFAAALCTEVIGIHALFGAFLAGVCMPPTEALRRFLRERLETLGAVLLLPLFFAFTGLRTEVGLLADSGSWLVCAAIVAVAIAGKLGGTLLAARATGTSWGDAFSLGVLMNTRGLVELIVLNLGFDLGVLSPRIFTMLVVMALVTTCMTGPLLHLRVIVGRRGRAASG